ncbi:alpha/beta hydrolase [Amycolatopsis minnesotensis]|uniref:Alpha/beta hydrolase n=1 Tax=Amycolatopsis minnesotensis TaxID=337894 RepID=A0ABP5CRV2_9PSEU
MAPPLTRRVLEPRPGLSVTVREAGDGPAALVLHGGAGPDSVTSIVDHLAPGHRVLAPTHPGWDGTPRPDWFSGVGELAATYLGVLEESGMDEVTVVGTSLGGWVAAELAVRDGGRRVARLVLIGASGPEIPGPSITMPGQGGPLPPGRGPSPEAMAALRAYAGPDMADPELGPRLADVRVPALLLWGENDVVVPPEFGRAYAELFADARFELIPGGGHLPYREAPEATFAVLKEFLGR